MKVSPKRVKRKTSPRRVKRKTSPRRVKRKTSPRRKMNAIYGEEEIERQLERDRRSVSAINRIARERAEYDMISDERLGDAKLVEILTYVDTCEELMKMQQTSRGTRTVIMENLPYIYMKLREKDKSLPVLVWTDSPEHNYMMFVNSCLDRERQKVIGDSIAGIETGIPAKIAMRGHRDYERYKELKRRLTHPSLPDYGANYILTKIMEGSIPFSDCIVDTVKGLLDLDFEYNYMINILKYQGCLTNETLMFLEILLERLNPTETEKYKILRFIYERIPRTIIYDYENGRIGNREALELLENYMREGL